jgi:hypothetical protein
MNEPANRGPRFYFSLLRLMAMLRGGDTARTENNALEAWVAGLMMYLIHYAFFAALLFPLRLQPWIIALLLVALAFWIWLFWLLLLYINSLVIKLLGGLFRTLPARRAQSILWGISTTAMAGALLKSNPALRELGAIWLVAVAMNLAAALVLAFSNAAQRSGE